MKHKYIKKTYGSQVLNNMKNTIRGSAFLFFFARKVFVVSLLLLLSLWQRIFDGCLRPSDGGRPDASGVQWRRNIGAPTTLAPATLTLPKKRERKEKKNTSRSEVGHRNLIKRVWACFESPRARRFPDWPLDARDRHQWPTVFFKLSSRTLGLKPLVGPIRSRYNGCRPRSSSATGLIQSNYRNRLPQQKSLFFLSFFLSFTSFFLLLCVSTRYILHDYLRNEITPGQMWLTSQQRQRERERERERSKGAWQSVP